MSAKDKSRLGRKTCKGAANLETNVDFCLFGYDLDRSYDHKESQAEKDAWTEKYFGSCAGRLGSDTFDDKFRFMPQTDHDKRLGKKMFNGAPQQLTVVDEIGFNTHLPDENMAGHEWSDVIKDCAGKPFNRKMDAVYGRYHVDLDHSDGHVAGRRMYGLPFTQVLVPETSSSVCSWSDIGKPVKDYESKRVDPETTTQRSAFRPPTEWETSRAERRAQKHGVEKGSQGGKLVYESTGVAAAMRSHEEIKPRRTRSATDPQRVKDIRAKRIQVSHFEGPLSPCEPMRRNGPSAQSLYVRDYHQLPVDAYLKSLEVPPPSYFNDPERAFRKGDEDMQEYYNHSLMARYRNMMAGKAKPAGSEAITQQSETQPSEAATTRQSRAEPSEASFTTSLLRRSSTLREAADINRDVPIPSKLAIPNLPLRSSQSARGSDAESRASRPSRASRASTPRSTRRSDAGRSLRSLPSPPPSDD